MGRLLPKVKKVCDGGASSDLLPHTTRRCHGAKDYDKLTNAKRFVVADTPGYAATVL